MYFYVAKVLKFLSGRYVFVPYFSFWIWKIHMGLMPNIDKLRAGIYPTGETEETTFYLMGEWIFELLKNFGLFKADKVGYERWYWTVSILSLVAVVIAVDTIYRNFIEGLTTVDEKPKEVADDEVKVPPYPFDEDKLQLIVGLKHDKLTLKKIKNPEWITIDDRGLFQNILVTGTIGTGKTASAMYPFSKQIMFYKSYDPEMKPGMLILDVKGNFYQKVQEFAEEAGRMDDLLIIELGGPNKYNPLHKPDLKPLVLSNRVKTVLGLFSPKGATDGYWLDKAELLIAECIKLIRLYNDGYVTFAELNKLVSNKTYLTNKVTVLVEDQDIMTKEELDLFDTARNYFEGEYATLAENTLSTIQSVVTQMTQFFYTDPEIRDTFAAPIEELNFLGFKDVIDRGKIVILKMNVAQYRNLAKTIAAYMKLDFQTEVMSRLVRSGANTKRPVFMVSDEYQEFVTATDAEFYAQSREPKCCSIVATQSYTSLINTLKDKDVVRTVTQNLINKIWLRTDDSFTVEEAQKQLGKEDKEKTSKSISESSGDVTKSRILGKLVSDKSSISETLNVNIVTEFIFEEQIFTQRLDVFTGVCFLSDGAKIIEPTVVHLQPYFSDIIKNQIRSKKMAKMNKTTVEDNRESKQKNNDTKIPRKKQARKRYYAKNKMLIRR